MRRVFFDGDRIHSTRSRIKSALAPTATLTDRYAGAAEDFGYVPQALIDWMARNPYYAAQYPGLASCLPGGPSIEPHNLCEDTIATPAMAPPQIAVPDLTVSTTITVQVDGCFHPGTCSTTQPPVQGVSDEAIAATASSRDISQPVKNAVPGLRVSTEAPLVTERPARSTAGGNPVQTQAQPRPQVIVIGSITVTANTASAFIIGMQTLAPGSSAIQIGDSTYSIPLKPTALIINGSPSAISPASSVGKGQMSFLQTQSFANGNAASPKDQALANLQADMASLIMNAFGPVAVPATPVPLPLGGGTLLTPGGPPLVVSRTTYPLPASGTTIFVNGSPSPIIKPTETANDVPGNLATGDGLRQPFVIGSITLWPGAPAVKISGTTYSLPPSSTAVIVNGNPSPLPGSTGDTNLKANPIFIAGTTINPGSPAVSISGTVYSLPLSGTAVLINGSPSPIILSSETTNQTPSPSSRTSFQPLIVAGQTINPGSPAITISGTTYSLPSSGTAVLVNGTPSPLPSFNNILGENSADSGVGSGSTEEESGGEESGEGNQRSEDGGNGTVYTGPGFESAAVEKVGGEWWMRVWVLGIGVVLGLAVGL
ncbi:MAG: hypothetical protein Q9166_005273 [cf. Caloplaca sp. 2 TL-2023]